MQQPRKQLNGTAYIIAAAILWGTSGTTQAFAPPSAHPLLIGTVRIISGALVLLVMAMGKGKMKRPFTQNWPWQKTIRAAVSISAYQLLFFNSVLISGVAVGTMVTIGSSPIIGGLIGYFIRNDKLSRRWYAATTLTLLGVLMLALSSGNLRVNGLGILLALGAGAAYTFYASFSIDVLHDNGGRESETAVAIIFSTGAILLTPLLFIYDLSWLTEPRGMFVAAHLGILTVAAAFTLFAHGLRHTSLANGMTLALAEPLTASLLGIFLLGEHLTPIAFTGIGLLFAGLALLATKK